MGKLTKLKPKKPNINERNATGRIAAINTKAGPKPLAMTAYRSMTDRERAKKLTDARADLKDGAITQKDFDIIKERIEKANAAEVDKAKRVMDQGKANKKSKPVSLSKGPAGTEPMSGAGRAAVQGFNKGGYAKKKNMYSKGGMANAGASVGGTQNWTAG